MTLIEVLFAIVILSGVMLALSRFGAAFTRASADAATLAIASDLASARIEVIRASDAYDALEADFEETETDSSAQPSLSGFEDYVRQTIVTPRAILSGSDTLAQYTTVTVVVTAPGLASTVSKSVDIARP
jgi:Tfp pilus assembly protein PilV